MVDAAGDPESTRVEIGVLGQPATATLAIPRADGYVRALAAGAMAFLFVHRDSTTRIDVYRAADGTLASSIDPDGWVDEGHTAIDVAHEVIYASVALAEGGVEIRRISLDGSASTGILSLDARFTPDGMPTDHYGLVIATDGRLVVAACADDACRVWRVAPGEAAGRPMTLPQGTPELCSLVGASDRWLIAYDEDTCYVDTGDAPFPWRAISLVDGTSHPISATPQVMAHRVIVVDGHPLAIAAHRSADWSTTDIEAYDVGTGTVHVLASALDNDPDGNLGWLGVSAQVLPDPWVLIEPWGVDAKMASNLPARILNVVSGELIELPIGTAGWS